MRKAVYVVVRHEPDHNIRSDFAPRPLLAFRQRSEHIELVVVEHLARVRLGDAGQALRERRREGELFDQVHTVGLGAGRQDNVFEILGEVLDGCHSTFEQGHIDGDFFCGIEVHHVREEVDV